ncbi:MAG: hypothetical protein ACFE9N_10630 [Promethearchaeota archaeon]
MSEFKEFFYVFSEVEKKEPKSEQVQIPFTKELSQIPTVENELHLIENKRELKRWKQSIGYYYLNPEKFKFGIRGLK